MITALCPLLTWTRFKLPRTQLTLKTCCRSHTSSTSTQLGTDRDTGCESKSSLACLTCLCTWALLKWSILLKMRSWFPSLWHEKLHDDYIERETDWWSVLRPPRAASARSAELQMCCCRSRWQQARLANKRPDTGLSTNQRLGMRSRKQRPETRVLQSADCRTWV